MKTVFIEAIGKMDLENGKEKVQEIAKLIGKDKKEINLTYSIQYKNLAEKLKSELEKEGIKVTKFFQILGCTDFSNLKRDSRKEIPVVHVGSGKFHALNLSNLSEKVIVFNGETTEDLSREDIEKHKKKSLVKKTKFLSSNRIGILVSTKNGQQELEKALNFKKEEDKKGREERKNYLFLCNNINEAEFENFNDVEFWVNTACPRIDEDSGKIVNIGDL